LLGPDPDGLAQERAPTPGKVTISRKNGTKEARTTHLERPPN
jgi:hypothetical protein